MLLYFNSTSRWGGFSFLELLFHGHRTAAAAPGIIFAYIVAQGGKVRRATKALLLCDSPFYQGSNASQKPLTDFPLQLTN